MDRQHGVVVQCVQEATDLCVKLGGRDSQARPKPPHWVGWPKKFSSPQLTQARKCEFPPEILVIKILKMMSPSVSIFENSILNETALKLQGKILNHPLRQASRQMARHLLDEHPRKGMSRRTKLHHRVLRVLPLPPAPWQGPSCVSDQNGVGGPEVRPSLQRRRLAWLASPRSGGGARGVGLRLVPWPSRREGLAIEVVRPRPIQFFLSFGWDGRRPRPPRPTKLQLTIKKII